MGVWMEAESTVMTVSHRNQPSERGKHRAQFLSAGGNSHRVSANKLMGVSGGGGFAGTTGNGCGGGEENRQRWRR